MADFKLVSDFVPKGDQPQAIEQLVNGLTAGDRNQVLLGVTGSGKTFTMANVVAQINRPALVIAHNKTLAAQLFTEFRGLFPENAVEYFVSYYDYYQPEAYIPRTDTYIEKDSSINDRIDKMRHSATRSLLERNDVLIVASVSCIYGLGSPEAYYGMLVSLEKGTYVQRDEVLAKLVDIQYARNDIDFHRGTFRVRGDVVEIFPAYEDSKAIRLEFFGEEVERITEIDPLRGVVIEELNRVAVYPATHYVVPGEKIDKAIRAIESELVMHRDWLISENKLVEGQRLKQRTDFDLEMIEHIGYCQGVENYSRHLDGRAEGSPPPTLLDFFPEKSLLFIDESHATVPQIGGMFRGDRARKDTLVQYGFRLPSARDNRPLTFEEFEARRGQTVFVSATPADFELEQAGGVVVEQVIRPTGLVDPPVIVKPAGTQVDDLLEEIRQRVGRGERVLVTTLTKRMAEDLAEYYADLNLRVKYLHSEIETLERTEIIRQLRLGEFDILIGINLLREGLDIPEVSLVAILDADKEGFLRSARSLIQTSGRAARNVNGTVIFYADTVTKSMTAAMAEMERRRNTQLAYNKAHGITPESVSKSINEILGSIYEQDYVTVPKISEKAASYEAVRDMGKRIEQLKKEMKEAADNLEFELAAEIRDEIQALEQKELEVRG